MAENKENATKQVKEKPTPAILREDYPFKAVGEPITDLDSLRTNGVLYEIKCPKCETAIRTQGCNAKSIYAKMVNGPGCVVCGAEEFIVRETNAFNK